MNNIKIRLDFKRSRSSVSVAPGVRYRRRTNTKAQWRSPLEWRILVNMDSPANWCFPLPFFAAPMFNGRLVWLRLSETPAATDAARNL